MIIKFELLIDKLFVVTVLTDQWDNLTYRKLNTSNMSQQQSPVTSMQPTLLSTPTSTINTAVTHQVAINNGVSTPNQSLPVSLLDSGISIGGSSSSISSATSSSAASSSAVLMNDSGMPVEQTQDGDWVYDPNEPRYCVCNQVSYGDMVACDNENVSVCPLLLSIMFLHILVIWE